MIFQNLKIKDFLLITGLLVSMVIFGYLYANSEVRNALWLKTYPIRAELSVRKISCSPHAPKWMEDIIRYQVKKNQAPSNQIAYLSPTGELFHCENGYVGEYPVLSDAVTENTRFRYASITKLWTSDTILDLIKQKKLTLADPINKYLTEINKPVDSRINDITIGDLLLHRGGFDRYSIFGHDMFGIGEEICPNHLDRLNHIELSFTPGKKTSYSNLGYCLLGEIIGRVDGKKYTQVIGQKYDLDNTMIKFIDNQRFSDETFYNYTETGITGIADIYTAFDYKGLASAAGLSGNAVDLVKQVKMMLSKPEPNILSYPKENCDLTKLLGCYGYAMYVYQPKVGQKKAYYRSGKLLGLSTMVMVDDKGGVVALLSNGENFSDVPIEELLYQGVL